MFFATAAQLWSMFVTRLKSPSATVTSASFAASVIVRFSDFTMWLMCAMVCSFASCLNLKTAHLLCIGSMILLL